jgi:hypothetical protein
MEHIKTFEDFSYITETNNGEAINESNFKKGDKVTIMHPTMIKPFDGVVSIVINSNGVEVLVLEDPKGVWDAKFAKLR